MAGEQEQVKDLNYYIDHPDEMTIDVMSKLDTDTEGDELGGTIDEVVKEAAKEGVKEGVTPPADKVEDPPATPPAKEAEKPEDPNGSVVKSKDGKHEIPYAVLDAERQGRRDAEQKAQTQQAEIDRLTALVAASKTEQPKGEPKVEPPADELEVMSEEDIAEVEKDFPAVAKNLRAQAKQLADLQTLVQTLAQSEGGRRQTEANTAKSSVQVAIDANPKLAILQSKDPEGWKQAIEFDNSLKRDPRNKSLDMAARFAKVVGMYESVYGAIELPAGTPAPAPTPAAPAAKAPAAPVVKKEDDAVVAARALIAKVDKESKENGKVTSLSDIPGGVPPETDPLEQLGLLSASELGNKFMTMDLKAISQILAKAA